jgi:transcriptional regulator with XRE-family HTH domain
MADRKPITSGVDQLDDLLGGLLIGDNVVWHDDSGSLASPFYLKFLQSCHEQRKPTIYVTFDRSPRNLLDKLGALADNPSLTVLDCFTCGKGNSSPVFLRFYDESTSEYACKIIKVEDPNNASNVANILEETIGDNNGDVRFIFESLTGMQELWGGEDYILNFYTHTCPRLYELNTVAYWLMEKKAHSPRLRAHISQIAQVVIELHVKRGTTSLTILKAEQRGPDHLHKAYNYWAKNDTINFYDDGKSRGGIALGNRIREFRMRRGLSQTELSRKVGLTPSTISQVESNQIFPSLPALFKMAEVLSIEVGSFFQDNPEEKKKVVFTASDSLEVKLSNVQEGQLEVRLLTPVDLDPRLETYLIEFPAKQSIPTHFFTHKGEELGFVISGELQMKVGKDVHGLQPGDVVYLTTEIPSQWKNMGAVSSKVLWIKMK